MQSWFSGGYVKYGSLSNTLLNVGPTAEGLIPEPSIERLKAMGDWMEVNSEAIYASSPSPYDLPEWGRFTTKPGKLYAHIYVWPADGKLVIADPQLKVTKAYLLADPQKTPLTIMTSESGITIQLPANAPDVVASVVAIEHSTLTLGG